MAVVLGTSAGFVTTAPTSDPDGSFVITLDTFARAVRDTTPSGTIKIIDIGWWCDSTTNESNYEVGIYSSTGTSYPNTAISLYQTNAKGTTTGWKKVTVDIDLNPETVYWIAVQLDDTSSNTSSNLELSGSRTSSLSATTLPGTWGDQSEINYLYSFYALIESSGVTRKIKIAGTFVDKPIKVKVGGVFVDKITKIKVGGIFQDA